MKVKMMHNFNYIQAIQFILHSWMSLPKKSLGLSEKHTIFASNNRMSPHKLQPSLHQDRTNFPIFGESSGFQRSLYGVHPSPQYNNWLYSVQLLNRKHKINLKIDNMPGKKKKKQEIIRDIQRNMPSMKQESTLQDSQQIENYMLHGHSKDEISFNGKYNNKIAHMNKSKDKQKLRKGRHKQQEQQIRRSNTNPKIRKISILSINSSKSVRETPSPQLAYNTKKSRRNFIQDQMQIDMQKNLYMPITNVRPERAFSRQGQVHKQRTNHDKNFSQKTEDLNDSHYNNQKYYNKNDNQLKQRFHTDNPVQNEEYQNEIKRLRKELKRSQTIINTMKIKQLQNQVEKLKQKDKKYDEIIKDFVKNKQKQGQIQRQRRSQQKSIPNNIENVDMKNPRVKTQIRQQQALRKSTKSLRQRQRKKPSQVEQEQKFHILADQTRQSQCQRKFLLLNPQKIREKMTTCYQQLKRHQPPEISINPFKIPKIPSGHPKNGQSIDQYLSLAQQLYKCLELQGQVQQMDIVIRKYKNCINFNIAGTTQTVIWGFDGKLYVGEWVEIDGESKKQGTGLEFTNQYCYKGKYKNGKREGFGIIQYYNGSVYEGQWKQGRMNGKGIFFDKSNLSYFQGQWDKGQQIGRGIIKYTKKHFYSGEFKKLIKSGKGTQFFQNEDIYEGRFDMGQRNGSGIFYYHTGQFFVGDFLNSKRHGIGFQLTNQFSQPNKQNNKRIQQYYYGQFNKGFRSGYGILRKIDGLYFFGYFHNNLAHGPGIMQNKPYFEKSTHNNINKLKITGIWKNGELVVTNKNIEASEKSQSRQF